MLQTCISYHTLFKKVRTRLSIVVGTRSYKPKPDGSKEKTARQVVTKVKALQKLDSSEKVEGNKAAFSRFEQEHAKKGHVEADPTERYGGRLVRNPVTCFLF